MRTRMVQMGGAMAAVVLAVTVAQTEAFARSDKESCSTTSTDIIVENVSDSTEVECSASTGPPNEATAKASDLGVAESDAEDGSKAESSASGDGAEALAD